MPRLRSSESGHCAFHEVRRAGSWVSAAPGGCWVSGRDSRRVGVGCPGRAEFAPATPLNDLNCPRIPPLIPPQIPRCEAVARWGAGSPRVRAVGTPDSARVRWRLPDSESLTAPQVGVRAPRIGGRYLSIGQPPPNGSRYPRRRRQPLPDPHETATSTPRTARGGHPVQTTVTRWQRRAESVARWQSRADFASKIAQNCHFAERDARDCHLGDACPRPRPRPHTPTPAHDHDHPHTPITPSPQPFRRVGRPASWPWPPRSPAGRFRV